jgi:hypothetical protein
MLLMYVMHFNKTQGRVRFLLKPRYSSFDAKWGGFEKYVMYENVFEGRTSKEYIKLIDLPEGMIRDYGGLASIKTKLGSMSKARGATADELYRYYERFEIWEPVKTNKDVMGEKNSRI